ncbi:MAG: ArsR/SmtB family transcription factor [Acidobacteriaceae bacterium]
MARNTVDLPRIFAALSDRTRLRLLNLMRDREVCVCYFVDILHQSQPKISRHLAYLRRAGIVSARREGKWMHYRIARPADAAAAAILEATLQSFELDKEMRADRTKLGKTCCAPVTKGVPLPVQLTPWKA